MVAIRLPRTFGLRTLLLLVLLCAVGVFSVERWPGFREATEIPKGIGKLRTWLFYGAPSEVDNASQMWVYDNAGPGGLNWLVAFDRDDGEVMFTCLTD